MRNIASIKKTVLLSGLFLAFLLFLICNIENQNLKSLSINSSICVLLSVFFLFLKHKKITGGLLFYLCVILMHCGQIFLIALDWHFSEALTTSIAISDNISFSTETVFLTTIGCLVISIALFLFEKNQNNIDTKASAIKRNENQNEFTGYSSLGWLIVIFILFLTVLSDLTRAYQVRIYGYADGFRQTNIILYYCDLLFPLILFTTMSLYRDNRKFLIYCFAFTTLRSLFSAFFIGSRGEAVLDILLCIYALFLFSKDKKFYRKIKRITIIAGVLAVFVLPLTGMLRASESINAFSYFVKYNPLIYFLTEFGGSIVNVRLAIEYQQTIPLSNFFLSFLSIMPLSSFWAPQTNGISGDYAEYLNRLYNGELHLGGSLIGESVFWFKGILGTAIYLILIVGLLTFVLRKIGNSNGKYSSIVSGPLFFLLYQLFYQIRGTVSSLQTGIKIAIYFILILFLLRNALFKRQTKKVFFEKGIRQEC